MTFGAYLTSVGHGDDSCRAAERSVRRLHAWLAGQGKSLAEVAYADVLEYVGELQAGGRPKAWINRELQVAGHLMRHAGLPDATRGHRLRGVAEAAPPSLLSARELEAVLRAYVTAPRREGPHYSGAGSGRAYGHLLGGVALGLIVCQGLEAGELVRLGVGDVDVARGVAWVPAGRVRLGRELALRGAQVAELRDYLAPGGGRAALTEAIARIRAHGAGLSGAGDGGVGTGEAAALLPTVSRGRERMAGVLRYLGREVRARSRTQAGIEVRSLRQLRQSRIAAWVAEFGLREAQALAGLRAVDTVQRRYDRRAEADLIRKIGLYHPLR